MIFKDNFYRINSMDKSEDQVHYSIQIDKSHSIFKGHFPGNPVTPGVAQLEIIKELTADVIGQNCRLKELANCKFLKVMNPEIDAKVEVVIRLLDKDFNSQKINAVIQNENGVFLKASATYSIL